jgi:putative addiction module antidote
MITLKARAVGNSTGVTLPKEVTDRLKVKAGDSLYLTESPDGYRLTAYDPEFARQMEAAEKVMRRYKDALRQLAK